MKGNYYSIAAILAFSLLSVAPCPALMAASPKTTWAKGMDDDAGQAAATAVDLFTLPGAETDGQATAYPVRDRLYTQSLDGTWNFKLVPGLTVAETNWTDGFAPIQVPGNWATQGYRNPTYGNQISELSGLYERKFRVSLPTVNGGRGATALPSTLYPLPSTHYAYILRFDGVLFAYRVWLNGQFVGQFGSAFQMAQWDVTDKLVDGVNTLRVQVMTRSKGWLFDTNDCWCLAGIQRSVELYTVPKKAAIEDIVFRYEEDEGTPAREVTSSTEEAAREVTRGTEEAAREVTSSTEEAAREVTRGTEKPVVLVTSRARAGKVTVGIKARGDFARVYVSLVDEDGRHAADVDAAPSPRQKESSSTSDAFETNASTAVASPHLWSPDDPYLYDLVVTLVDEKGAKIQRISQKVGLRTVKLDGMSLLVNGKKTFLNGVAWNEIDPKEGRAISYRTRREQMVLMKKAHVNCIRTAHYPFGPDFYELADEMGFFIIDEVPFGSRGREFLMNAKYRDELLARTRNTIARDKNHPSVVFWTFGNENPWSKNTAACLALAKELDPMRPRGLPQIGSSQFNEMLFHPERDVDFIAGHYLNRDRMEKAEKNAKKPMVQTEFAHACGNGFCDFERSYSQMRRNADKWMGGCIWAWIDQSVMHPFGDTEEGLKFRNQTELPKDMRRDLPSDLQGNFLDGDRFIDSWGDRATDGIVYGDGTPKDGYWLVKKLYGAGDGYFAKETTTRTARDSRAGSGQLCARESRALRGSIPLPRLRIGRKMGMDQRIQSIRKCHNSCQQPYLVDAVAHRVNEEGECLLSDAESLRVYGSAESLRVYGSAESLRVTDSGATSDTVRVEHVKYVLSSPSNKSAWLEGTIVISNANGKTVVSYDLKPNEAARERDMLEVGLVFAMPPEMTRVDWQGLGPLTSVPGKSQMNDFGAWAMHKDDYRFIGPRAEVAYALARQNKGDRAVVLESGTGQVSFENLDGTILLTECAHVAGYGGKGSPSGTRKLKDISIKGEVKLYEIEVNPSDPDVVPDLTYSRHYGF